MLPPAAGGDVSTPENNAISVTSTPSSTPSITPSPTLGVPMVIPKTEDTNCRFGPGTAYLAIGGLSVGNSVPILGRTADSGFWQIANPNNALEKCFISAGVTDATGDLASIPVVGAPNSIVTGVTIANPPNINVPGCIGPYDPLMIKGTITVNGPANVTYHFASQQGDAHGTHTVNFTSFGTKEVTDNSFKPPLVPGSYWVKLIVTVPTGLTAQAGYQISCP